MYKDAISQTLKFILLMNVVPCIFLLLTTPPSEEALKYASIREYMQNQSLESNSRIMSLWKSLEDCISVVARKSFYFGVEVVGLLCCLALCTEDFLRLEARKTWNWIKWWVDVSLLEFSMIFLCCCWPCMGLFAIGGLIVLFFGVVIEIILINTISVIPTLLIYLAAWIFGCDRYLHMSHLLFQYVTLLSILFVSLHFTVLTCIWVSKSLIALFSGPSMGDFIPPTSRILPRRRSRHHD